MAEIRFHEEKNINLSSIKALYANVGWTSYTKDSKTLKKAFKNSLVVMTSRESYNNGLLGLVRVVGDGETIIYIQDLLVRAKYRRQGIGTELIKMVLKKYKHIRQKVLITDDTEETRLFYESLGFKECGAKNLLAFVKIGK